MDFSELEKAFRDMTKTGGGDLELLGYHDGAPFRLVRKSGKWTAPEDTRPDGGPMAESQQSRLGIK